jgi:hypothetical protein
MDFLCEPSCALKGFLDKQKPVLTEKHLAIRRAIAPPSAVAGTHDQSNLMRIRAGRFMVTRHRRRSPSLAGGRRKRPKSAHSEKNTDTLLTTPRISMSCKRLERIKQNTP